jgi:hypothetical protein
MTILNAVYESASKYNNPDGRYGYGIPDMQTAYLLLKKKQNSDLYGNDWLFVNPDSFIDTLHVKLIGQLNGDVKLFLQNELGNIVSTISLTTEEEEVYDTTFFHLTNLFPGKYLVKYTDSVTTRTIAITKNSSGALSDWLVAAPVPFANQLSIFLKAPENGNVNIRLIDVTGKVIETKELNIVQNNSYMLNFISVPSLARGVYFIQYAGTLKKTIKVVK